MSPNKQTNNNRKLPFFFKLLLDIIVRIIGQATKKNDAEKMMYDKPEHVTSRLRRRFAGEMWKTLELWARYTLRYCNLGLVGYCDRSVASRKAERNAHSCSWFRWGMRTLSGTGLGSVLGYFGQEHGWLHSAHDLRISAKPNLKTTNEVTWQRKFLYRRESQAWQGSLGPHVSRSTVEKSKSVRRKIKTDQSVMEAKISSKWKVAAKVQAAK